MNDTPCQMGCPCPGPKPAAIYKDFTTAVDALKLVFLKPGHMMPVYYYDASTDIHCLIGVGNIDPNKLKLIISDSSDKWSLLLKFSAVDASIDLLFAMQHITDVSIADLFSKKYSVTVFNSIADPETRVYNTSTSALYKDGDIVTLKTSTSEQYRWVGWYNNPSGEPISENDTYDITIHSSVKVKGVAEKADMYDASIYGLFALLHMLDTSLSINELTVDPEENLITVIGTDSSDFVNSYFTSGNNLTFNASLTTPYNFEKYIVTAKDPAQIKNWESIGDNESTDDIHTKTTSNPTLTLEEVKTDVSINAVIKEVKFKVLAESYPIEVADYYITGDNKGKVIRGEKIELSFDYKTGMEQLYDFTGWYIGAELKSTEPAYSPTPTENTTYVAKFKEKQS